MLKEVDKMTKEQLLALKPYPTVKHNDQYPVPEVSVEAKKVILQCFDKHKRDAKMDLYPFLPYDEENKGLKWAPYPYNPNDLEEVIVKEDGEEVPIKKVRKL